LGSRSEKIRRGNDKRLLDFNILIFYNIYID